MQSRWLGGILPPKSPVQIFREFQNLAELESEFDQNMKKARTFVPGAFDVKEREMCDLVLVHPLTGEWYPISVEVVHIAPSGVGLQFSNMSAEKFETLEEFIFCSEEEPLTLEPPSAAGRERMELSSPTPAIRVLVPSHFFSEPDEEVETDPGTNSGFILEQPEEPAPSTQSDEGVPPTINDARFLDELSPPSSHPSRPPPRNVQERVRALNMRERDSMARTGTLTERVALERAYGASVWDALLSNSALTGPEVARIAKNGNVTIPHLKQIVSNAAWLAKAEVRRALLTNPRLTPPQIERVLRSLPPAELRQLPKQTAYPPQVRAVAQRLLPRT